MFEPFWKYEQFGIFLFFSHSLNSQITFDNVFIFYLKISLNVEFYLCSEIKNANIFSHKAVHFWSIFIKIGSKILYSIIIILSEPIIKKIFTVELPTLHVAVTWLHLGRTRT